MHFPQDAPSQDSFTPSRQQGRPFPMDASHEHNRPAGAYPSDDEIDLVDLLKVLVRRRYWLLGVFAACVLASLAYALSLEPRYAFTTSIELGEFGPDEMVASSSAARNVVEDRILLSVKRDFLEAESREGMPFNVTTESADGSRFFNLVTEVGLDQQELVGRFHQQVFERLRGEHQSRLSIMEEQSEALIASLKEAVRNEERRLASLETLSQKGLQSVDNIGDGESWVAASSSKEGMQAEIGTADMPLTLLLSQLQVSEKMSETETRLNELRRELRKEETILSWIRPTRAEDFAIASLSPVGTSRSLVVVLGALLGLMLGLFVAFVAEFAVRVRESGG